MRIVIVGDGKIGSALAEQLSREGHEITIVDRSGTPLQRTVEDLDILSVEGNGATYATQMEAGVDEADLVIAVTAQDELNLLCCTVAKRVGDCAAIARVRTPDYSDEASYLKEKLGLAMIINPEMEAANEITHVFSLPAALGVNSFAHGQAQMIRFKIPENNRLDGQKVMTMARNISGDVLVCAVEREKQVFIPDGNFELHQGDVVSFIATSKAAKEFFERIGMPNKPVHNTMIIGGGKAAYYLGKMLIDMGIEVKIIEIDRKRCRELSELLPQATIINGDGTDEELLNEEEIAYVDSLVPLTGIDEENVLLALHAREVSDAKVITKVNRNAFHNLIDKLDIGSVIYPKYITAEAIVAYVRAKQASVDSSNVETIYHMFDSRAEAIEFNVSAKSRVTDVPLKDLNTKDNLLIACINRSGKIIIPGGMDSIQAGDTVVIVTTHTGFQNIEDILR